ncbi:dUTP diphosphatase [Waterburya agarophytonicola K14]|uniref:Deoxyuridine 5'-triphosphate nucleotidohydrolase n=1 Tax=Waterburya agarophytonicola KI4 TaxID=2874699 RepID=A0A964BR21_9CYAN|nr:dUTP diphosphatase [Waterburya agarophytonicola]MCC0177900.1 dUTP diphosphatase [Waterburya agarophytonicola KI4]
MNIEIIKLNQAAIVPYYAHPGDAGLDLFSIDETEILPGETKLIKTGIAIALPPHTEAQIRPRSGLALKHSITVLNSPGTIDAGYRGELGVLLINHGKKAFKVFSGMKVAQMVVAPIFKANITVVEQLNDTSRGSNGFGSTGKTQ